MLPALPLRTRPANPAHATPLLFGDRGWQTSPCAAVRVTHASERTAPAASAPASGESAMIAATVAVLTPVSRLSSGVYSSVAAAEKATMARNSGGSCPTPTPTSGLAPCSNNLA